jgi:hypothetical protein
MNPRDREVMKALERFCKAKGLPTPGRLCGGSRALYSMPDRVVVLRARQEENPDA